tara:strand:+ start:189 stop:476 length:288 start_codon:yes stop_codon:yes gene_type:complete
LLIREFGSLAVFALVNLFFIPFIRAQKDLRLFAALLPALSLEGLVVTAVFSLLPGLAARYLLTPFAVKPPEADLSPLFTENFLGILPFLFFTRGI